MQGFIQRHLDEPTTRSVDGCDIEGVLILTVAVPAESDTLCGLRIEKLSTPGRYEPSVRGFPAALTLRFRYRRLGKLRISRSGPDTIKIDSTNVRQFTINWRNGSPGFIDVEGQVVNRNNWETFVRLSKDAENMWRVRLVLRSSATF